MGVMITIVISAVLYDQMQRVRPSIMFGFSNRYKVYQKRKKKEEKIKLLDALME